MTALVDVIETWPLMTSPWPAIVMTILYVLSVKLIGPTYMSTRDAKEITSTIVIYNGIQIGMCCWWLYEAALFFVSCTLDEVIDATLECNPMPPQKELAGRKLVYFYHLMKLTEFVETVFFVLRKKQNQVSFLHVYHHSNMATMSWIYVKYIQCFQGITVASLNTFVHVIMYSYYLLASLGPSVRPYLWWKKYLTGLQIVQFLIVISYFILMGINQCNVPWSVITFSIGNTISFLVLFLMFYKKTYSPTITPKST